MSFRVQNQIRQNASDIRTYLDDLFNWEEEVNKHGKKKPISLPPNPNKTKRTSQLEGKMFQKRLPKQLKKETLKKTRPMLIEIKI